MSVPFKAAAQTPVLVASAAFRQAMSEVTAAVHVITTVANGAWSGLTASAVTALSDAPPMMLACIREDSRTLAQIRLGGVFCINTLSGADQDAAEIFAGRRGLEGAARFEMGAWERLVTGAPSLGGALCAFDCRLVDIRQMATHAIVIGEVVALGGRQAGKGLIYRNRRFGAF
jgi:flavin reductase (DIM6/NTAB) family NADH-FMN oxidoreductase RutF